jgi:lysophospholipase L1-like esterase
MAGSESLRNPVRRMRRIAFTLLALSIGAVLTAFVLELGVLAVFGEQPKFPRRVVGAPFGLRINQPNAVYRHKSADTSVWFQINGQGMRAERDYARAKPPGVKRIVSLGDSFTVGYEVEGDETFSAVLERELAKSLGPVEVLNAGVSGYSNAEELLYLERELLAYDPDLVLISFFANDLVDNQRTGLFRLENGALVQTAESYVPAGALGDLLNTNPFFNWLSGYSNAFALLNDRATLFVKRRMVKENEAQVAQAAAPAAPAAPTAGADTGAKRALAAAIFERIWQTTRARGIPLLIQSIPIPGPDPAKAELVDVFPLADFDVDRPGLVYYSARDALQPHLGRDLLYWQRSHGHWTPLAHRLDGEALARLIRERGLLGEPTSASAAN